MNENTLSQDPLCNDDVFSVVTAYFDIGRSQWNNQSRSNEHYLNAFRFWARLRNELIVYTSADFAEKIRAIRAEFGRLEQTKVVVIDDFCNIYPDLRQRIADTMANPVFRKFRTNPNRPKSRELIYNYLMFLKPYFVTDAINRGLVSHPSVTWLDFGYNQGGELYSKPEEFDFLWSYPLQGKIHMFSHRNNPDDCPIFEIVRTLKGYLIGGIIAAPAERWSLIHSLFHTNMEHLLACGMVDDDQVLMLMIYNQRPELFRLYCIHYLLEGLLHLGASHLSTIPQKKHKRIKWNAKEHWKQKKYRQAISGYLSYVWTKMKREREQVGTH